MVAGWMLDGIRPNGRRFGMSGYNPDAMDKVIQADSGQADTLFYKLTHACGCEASSPNGIDYPPLTGQSRDHLATITDVYVTSLSSLSPFLPFLVFVH